MFRSVTLYFQSAGEAMYSHLCSCSMLPSHTHQWSAITSPGKTPSRASPQKPCTFPPVPSHANSAEPFSVLRTKAFLSCRQADQLAQLVLIGRYCAKRTQHAGSSLPAPRRCCVSQWKDRMRCLSASFDIGELEGAVPTAVASSGLRPNSAGMLLSRTNITSLRMQDGT